MLISSKENVSEVVYSKLMEVMVPPLVGGVDLLGQRVVVIHVDRHCVGAKAGTYVTDGHGGLRPQRRRHKQQRQRGEQKK